MTDGCRVEHLSIDAAAGHRAAWADLAARTVEPCVFNMPAFAVPAARFIPGLRPRVLLVWRGTRLIGLCLTTPGPPGWPVRAWLHPQAVAAFPLLDRDEAEQALAAMLRWAAGRLRPGLLLSGLPSNGATARLLKTGRFARLKIEERRRAVLPGGQTATGLDGKAGKEVRRQARRLAEQGAVAIRSSTAPDDIASALDAFLELEAAGWKGRRGTALAASKGLTAFVQAMTLGMAAEAASRIDRLELNGRPIAIGIVLRSGPVAYFWKTAFDESYARFSPGVHLAEAISRLQAGESNLDLTDSCAVPNHAMIDRLWPERIVVEDVLVGTVDQGELLAAFAGAEQLRRRLRAFAKEIQTSFRMR